LTPLSRHTIVISPIGDFSSVPLAKVRSHISDIFGCSTRVIPITEEITFALDPKRHQYLSTAILETFADSIPPETLKLLALTGEDLFIPILTYVYGEAQLGGKACIISTFRLQEGLSPVNPIEALATRVAKEAVHELGHTFNLRHCKDPVCIMHYCRNIEDVDRKSDQLCRYCRILLSDEVKKLAG
jgi:archaemetzincin